jgi:hypothetical protein
VQHHQKADEAAGIGMNTGTASFCKRVKSWLHDLSGATSESLQLLNVGHDWLGGGVMCHQVQTLGQLHCAWFGDTHLSSGVSLDHLSTLIFHQDAWLGQISWRDIDN